MHRNRKGFTLIELLVVIAIIGILATIIVGAVKKAKALAVTKKCITNMKEIGTALAIYNERARKVPGYGGMTDWATLVSSKLCGLDPLALNCPGNPSANNTNGNALVANSPFLANDPSPQKPNRTGTAGIHCSYQGRREFITGTSLPIDAVSEASTPIGGEHAEYHTGTRLILFMDGHAAELRQWRDNTWDNSAQTMGTPEDPYDLRVLSDQWDGD